MEERDRYGETGVEEETVVEKDRCGEETGVETDVRREIMWRRDKCGERWVWRKDRCRGETDVEEINRCE